MGLLEIKPNLLFVNGSRHGINGQSQALIHYIRKTQSDNWNFDELNLSSASRLGSKDIILWEEKFRNAHAFVFLTGTYWGSPLQYFLEEVTHWETSNVWLGKPAAVMVTMHSAGGKGVLSRLQGVLNTLGLTIPPLSGFCYSLTMHLAQKTNSSHLPDFWNFDDIPIIMANLRLATQFYLWNADRFQAWAVDRFPCDRRWL